MEDVRWKQRLDNLTRAVKIFEECIDSVKKMPEDNLYQIALIGSFSFCFELSWKTLKDYLSYSGVQVYLPREVIKQAFQFNLIDDGQLWIDMLEERNIMAHVYDETRADEAAKSIQSRYYKGIKQVFDQLQSKLL